MDRKTAEPYCLVTISDEAFSIATEVLIYSFLKYNPWFKGDVVVIADDLPAPHVDRLRAICPVRLIAPDPDLRTRLDALRDAFPDLRDIDKRFYSFDVFRLSEYNRVVYLDSDMYCAGDISALFESSEPLLACPDGFTYGDRVSALLADTEEERWAPAQRYGRSFEKSFNAGVLSVGEPILGTQTHGELLAMLDVDRWASLGNSIFTDQMALNIYFENRFEPLPGIYNYMIFLEGYQKCLEKTSFPDARLIHFAGSIKPWNCYDPKELLDRAPRFIKFIDVWRELLEEARDSVDPGAMKRRFHRHKDWIADYNRRPLKPVGRLY